LDKTWQALSRAVARADAPQLGTIDAKATTAELIREIRDIEALLRRARQTAEKSSRRAELLLSEMLLGFSAIFNLAMMMDLRAKYDARILWEDDALNAGRVRIFFQNLLLTLASLLLSIRATAIGGDATAGRILARTYLELWDLAVAIATDRATCVGYMEWMQAPEEAKDHWRRFVSPGHAKRIVEAFLHSVDPSFRLHFRRFGKDAYARWSGTVHGNPLALITSVYARAGKMLRPALGGRFGPDSEISGTRRLLAHVPESLCALDGARPATRMVHSDEHEGNGRRGLQARVAAIQSFAGASRSATEKGQGQEVATQGPLGKHQRHGNLWRRICGVALVGVPRFQRCRSPSASIVPSFPQARPGHAPGHFRMALIASPNIAGRRLRGSSDVEFEVRTAVFDCWVRDENLADGIREADGNRATLPASTPSR
jgi:hypothetical protein